MLILSRPPVQPPTIPDIWIPITSTWTGWNGAKFELTSGAGGVAFSAGVVGLHEPQMTRFVSQSRAVHGERLRGWRAVPRDVRWPVWVYADSSLEWQDTYSRFMDSVHPEFEGVWRVEYAGSYRELRLTGVFDEDHEYEVDPHVMGWELYGVKLRAAQPFWTGAPVTRGPWTGATPVDFYGESGGPPFYLSSSSTLADATMNNPGDVPAYPVWTIDGELDDIKVGVGDVLIEPSDVDSGKRLVIDTDPRNVTALLGDIPGDGETFEGEDVTQALGFQPFAPIPPGGEVPIHIEGAGAGSVTCTLVPLYRRAF